MIAGRNDPCPCGSGRKFKCCHQRPFYPKEFFQVELKEFEIKNPIHYKLPPGISIIGVPRIYAGDPQPWDKELAELLKPLVGIQWNEKDKWQLLAKGRVQKLHHKLEAIIFHSAVFQTRERHLEQNYKNPITATLYYELVLDDPVITYATESFLFQCKYCLDVLAQLIANNFKLTGVKTYKSSGDDLIDKIEKNPLKDYESRCGNSKNLLKKNRPWIKYLVDMRNEVTHYSDLVGLASFLKQNCSDKKDEHVRIFYPSLTDGIRVSSYMNETWNNIKKLLLNNHTLFLQFFPERHKIKPLNLKPIYL